MELRRRPRQGSRNAWPATAASRFDGGKGRDVGAAWDAVAYGASGAAAIAILATSQGPLDRLWAGGAAVGYALGALAALVLVRRGVGVRGRAVVAAAVFAAVAVVPTVLHAGARAGSTTAAVKSDVLVVEQAAGSLLEGRNPYVVVHDDGPLAGWPAWAQDHFPYLAAVLTVGVPRVLTGPAPWTDARLLYLAPALAIALSSLRRSGLSAEARLRAFQVLFVLATGAPLVVTSGKEILVLALLLASMVALRRSHAGAAGVAAGAAAAMHQLAWVVVPILAFMPARSAGRRAAAIAASIAIVAVVPFVVWDAGAFVEDAVLYPLGVGQPVSASAFTPGDLLASLLPASRWASILLAALAVGIGGALAVRRGVRSASDAARWAGTLLLVALLLAPRVRLAYFALPANLLLWGRLFGGGVSEAAGPGVQR